MVIIMIGDRELEREREKKNCYVAAILNLELLITKLFLQYK